jgi:hypothetical protein
MITEVKHFKEQRDEIRRWEKLRDEKVRGPLGGPELPEKLII